MNPRLTFLMTILCLAGCAGNSKAPTDEFFQSDDFSFSVPAGWTAVKPDRDKTKAMLLLDGTQWQNAKAMIKVDVGSVAESTAKEFAEGFAKNTNGTVAADPLDFDGTPGVMASTASEDLNTPRNMIVIYRDSRAYLLMVGALEGVEVDKAVSHVRKSWEWTQPDEG